MIIAIASENTPKVLACESVFNTLKDKICPADNLKFVKQKVDPGVQAMPLSLDDLMTGAKNRAEKLFKILQNKESPSSYYIGLEGGFFLKYFPGREFPTTFLQSWVYILKDNIGFWGSSGAIEVPLKLAEKILNTGKELGEIIDEFASGQNIRSNQGAVGIFTNNIVTRQDFFESALIFAISPFLNSQIYQQN